MVPALCLPVCAVKVGCHVSVVNVCCRIYCLCTIIVNWHGVERYGYKEGGYVVLQLQKCVDCSVRISLPTLNAFHHLHSHRVKTRAPPYREGAKMTTEVCMVSQSKGSLANKPT